MDVQAPSSLSSRHIPRLDQIGARDFVLLLHSQGKTYVEIAAMVNGECTIGGSCLKILLLKAENPRFSASGGDSPGYPPHSPIRLRVGALLVGARSAKCAMRWGITCHIRGE